MNRPDDQDPVFEEYLKGETELSSRYRAAATQTPPATLDSAILTAAHREVKSKSKPFFSSWRLPLSIAAVIILGVGLAIFARHDPGFLSNGLDFGVAQNETLRSVVRGQFDKLADEPLQDRTKNGIAEEPNQRSTAPANKSPFSDTTSGDLVVMNERDATGQNKGLINGTAYPKAPPTVRRMENRAAPAPTIAVKSKKSRTLSSPPFGNPIKEPELAEANLQSEEKTSLRQSKPSLGGLTPKNTRLKSSLNADRQIEKIRKLWRNGDKEKAKKQLIAYLKAKPDYDIENLKQKLDSDFVDRTIKEFSKE